MSRISVLLLRNCRGITEVTGGEAYILGLLSSVDPSQCDIRLVCVTDPQKGETSWLKQLKTRGIPFDNVPVARPTNPGDLTALFRLIREYRPDVIHAMDHRSDVVGVIAGRLTGRPVVAWFGGWTGFVSNSFRGRVYPFIDRQLLRHADAVIADSTYLASQLDLGSRGPTVVAIPNGVDLNRFDPDSKARSHRQPIFAEEGVVTIGTIGRIHPNKAQLNVVKAAAELLETHPQCRFLICGEASPGFEGYMREILDFIAQRGIGDRVRVMGVPAAQIPDVLSTLDIVLAPCHTESCSFSILESMAMCKPVVAAEAGGNPALVSDGETGLLVPPHSWEALRDASRVLLDNPQQRAGLGERGRLLVEQNYQLKMMGQRTTRVYETVIAHRRNGLGWRSSTARQALREELLAAVAKRS